MNPNIYTIIAASGSYIPTQTIDNAFFENHTFHDDDGIRLTKSNKLIIDQFKKITGISQRRYVSDELNTSDIAYFAAKDAIESAQIDPETLDYIIVAHNFGDVSAANHRSDLVPALASRVKFKLNIRNPNTVAYDLPFGCAGWLQGMIQADQFIKAGYAKQVLVIGAETLSRVCDPHDRDSMIFADGAGALILKATTADEPVGVLAHLTKSYANELTYVLKMGRSANPLVNEDGIFLKMQGRKLYEQVLKIVPELIKECLIKADLSICAMSKLLIHQANNKMDEAILRQLFDLYDRKDIPADIMPMTISWLGNSSVATLPTLYDLIAKHQFTGQSFAHGDHLMFAAVGAGVNVNALAYKVPEFS